MIHCRLLFSLYKNERNAVSKPRIKPAKGIMVQIGDILIRYDLEKALVGEEGKGSFLSYER